MDPVDGVPGLDPEAPPAAPVATGVSAPTSDAVKNSPEYKELQKQMREMARENGTLRRNEATARAEAERQRIERETAEQEAMTNEISDLLGADGLAAWDEFAQLSQTDPRAAARKWAELTGKMADARAEQQINAPEVPAVPPQQPTPQVPPPPRTLDGGAPLQPMAAPDPDEQIIQQRTKEFQDLAERNLRESNRVTDRERADGMMGYLEAAYRKFMRSSPG